MNSKSINILNKLPYNNDYCLELPKVYKEKEYMYDNVSSDKITTPDLNEYSSHSNNKHIVCTEIHQNYSQSLVRTSLGRKIRDSLELDHLLKNALHRLNYHLHGLKKDRNASCLTSASYNRKDVKFDLKNKEIICDTTENSYEYYTQMTESDSVDDDNDEEEEEETKNNLKVIDKKNAAAKLHSKKHYQDQKQPPQLVSMDSKNMMQLEGTYESQVIKCKIKRFRKMMKDNSFSQMNPISLTSSGSDLFNELSEPLSLGLTELAIVRPSEPIKYLGSWLKCYSSMK
ncbi:unnamed protein product [Heterobilharzia americana]|nr:unnamed protein product [Heterobilharzia americana]